MIIPFHTNVSFPRIHHFLASFPVAHEKHMNMDTTQAKYLSLKKMTRGLK